MQYKEKLSELVPGDKVVVARATYSGIDSACEAEVKNVSETRVTVFNTSYGLTEAQFLNSSGIKVGESNSRFPTMIHVGEQAERHLKLGREAMLRRALAAHLENVSKIVQDRDQDLSDAVPSLELALELVKNNQTGA